MTITFKANINIPQKVRAKTAQFIENFGVAMEATRSEIRLRIDQGEGPNGKLEPYSKSYAKYKANYGSRGRNPNVVNMQLSGNMIDSMQTEIVKTANGAIGKIKFGPSEVKKVEYNLKKRKFFGLKPEDIKKIKIRTFQK